MGWQLLLVSPDCLQNLAGVTVSGPYSETTDGERHNEDKMTRDLVIKFHILPINHIHVCCECFWEYTFKLKWIDKKKKKKNNVYEDRW